MLLSALNFSPQCVFNISTTENHKNDPVAACMYDDNVSWLNFRYWLLIDWLDTEFHFDVFVGSE